MTNGAPTSRCRDEAARSDEQAAEIRRLLAAGMDAPTVAARVKCTLRRVQDVAANAASAPPSPKQAVDGIPAPRKPAQANTAAGPRPAADTLLNRAKRIDDPRIQAARAHITADLADLAALIRCWEERDKAAHALVNADRRAEALRRAYEQRHPGRRHTDRQEQSA